MCDTPSYKGSRHLLEENLALIKRVITFTCRRHRFTQDETEEFTSIVYVKLADNDRAIIRAWEGRSSLSTYLSVVVERWALDYRISEWGKWRPSAQAKRMGPLAVELEQLLKRDKRTLEEAQPILAPKYGNVTLESLRKTAGELPDRNASPVDVPLVEAENVPDGGAHDIENQASTDDRRRTAERVAALMRNALAKLSEDDRMYLQLRYGQGMTVAQIARAFQREQKLLYRRIERCMLDIREELRASGVSDEDVMDLIGRDDIKLDFALGNGGGNGGNGGSRPSKESDERVATKPEETE
jgi:RNA polymerase sigma factor for flagellar operon FliA